MFCCTHSHFISSPFPGESFVPDSKAFAYSTNLVHGGTSVLARPFSSQVRQCAAQFLGCPKQRIFGRLFRRIQYFADGPQFQAVIMLQLENHALARRQLLESPPDASAPL